MTAEKFTIKQLMERYNLKTRQSIYNWLSALKLTLDKDESGRATATTSQIELLDQLNKHIKSGGVLANFTPLSITTLDSTIDKQIDNQIDSQREGQIDTVNRQIDTQFQGDMYSAIASKFVSQIATFLQPPNPLWYMQVLEQAAVNHWLLTTKEVRELIGVKPRLIKGEKAYRRGCWLFEKVGQIGSQTAWRVSKIVDNLTKS